MWKCFRSMTKICNEWDGSKVPKWLSLDYMKIEFPWLLPSIFVWGPDTFLVSKLPLKCTKRQRGHALDTWIRARMWNDIQPSFSLLLPFDHESVWLLSALMTKVVYTHQIIFRSKSTKIKNLQFTYRAHATNVNGKRLYAMWLRTVITAEWFVSQLSSTFQFTHSKNSSNLHPSNWHVLHTKPKLVVLTNCIKSSPSKWNNCDTTLFWLKFDAAWVLRWPKF